MIHRRNHPRTSRTPIPNPPIARPTRPAVEYRIARPAHGRESRTPTPRISTSPTRTPTTREPTPIAGGPRPTRSACSVRETTPGTSSSATSTRPSVPRASTTRVTRRRAIPRLDPVDAPTIAELAEVYVAPPDFRDATVLFAQGDELLLPVRSGADITCLTRLILLFRPDCRCCSGFLSIDDLSVLPPLSAWGAARCPPSTTSSAPRLRASGGATSRRSTAHRPCGAEGSSSSWTWYAPLQRHRATCMWPALTGATSCLRRGHWLDPTWPIRPRRASSGNWRRRSCPLGTMSCTARLGQRPSTS